MEEERGEIYRPFDGVEKWMEGCVLEYGLAEWGSDGALHEDVACGVLDVWGMVYPGQGGVSVRRSL